MDARIDEVIEFWFGPDARPTAEITKRWYVKDAAFDDEIRRRFGALHAAVAGGELAAWDGSARGELARIIVLDQFSRNMFRGDPRAFATDPLALTLARALDDRGLQRELTYHQRPFALLPFMHCEDRATQAESVARFGALLEEARQAEADDQVIEMLTSTADYAVKHREIVDRFGRFPHRNATLGRATTAEETTFLSQPGSGF